MDNRGLHLAGEKAKSRNVPLICLYLVSPQDYEAHVTAPIRVDFILRNLAALKKDLEELNIPLYVETVEQRKKLSGRLIELCKEWGASHVYCNAEYEVDELRREAALTRDCLAHDISFNVVHDTCVVEPGKLSNGSGGQLSVYSPWHRKWCAYLNQHPEQLDEFPRPDQNPSSARLTYARLFEGPIPEAPHNKRLLPEEKQKFAHMWPAGEAEALVLAARTVVRVARQAAPQQRLSDDRKQGHSMWIGEVAWRDFYKHVLCHWPHICMNKPFKPEYSDIAWSYDRDLFAAWTDGRTGFPIVDAAMRQLAATGYMHNRCRMIVACFLAKDLLIDWRMGEKWFMQNLVDGDFASNNCGWGFSASCGVDPQPFFRIFNPMLQSEKFDLDGHYIRRWVPELGNVLGKAVHDPYGRGAEVEAQRNGYPRPIVDHKKSRERALAAYQAGIGRKTA